MDEATSKRLSVLRITFTVLLITIPAFIVVLAALRSAGSLPPLPSLGIVAAVLAFFAVLCIAAAYALRILVQKKGGRAASAYNIDMFLAYLIMGALLESVAIYGFVIGLLGGNWIMVIPFWAAAAFALLHLFPKKTIFKAESET